MKPKISLGKGDLMSDAIKFANKVAALSVSKFGAQSSRPILEEVLEFEAT